MSFFSRLFGRGKESPKEQPEPAAVGAGLEAHLAYLDTLRLPAMALSTASAARRSRIGGFPSLPGSVVWPEWKGKPTSFLCQLALDEIPADCERHGLPSTGMLYFFYTQDQDTWGFDPADAGSWHVIYTADVPSGDAPWGVPDGLPKEAVFGEKPVGFSPIRTYPDGQDERVFALDLDDDQCDEYFELRSSARPDGPSHQLFGHPSPVQGNDMELECQLASNGLYCGDASGYRDARAAELRAGSQDWILLLQLDSDDDAGMMWGDCGMLYFWIRKQDLAERRFDRCWMVLQCC